MNEQQKNKYKYILLKTLEAFKEFCFENNLTYFATGGTAIGAVRHNGIIPWDDDIDVCMLRKDYNRFLSLKYKLIGSGYEILSLDNQNYFVPFAKFCDANTTILERKNLPFVEGVFIDVFPLDNVTGNDIETRNRQIKYLKYFSDYAHTLTVHHISEIFKGVKDKQIWLIRSFLKDNFFRRPLTVYFFQRFLYLDKKIQNVKGKFLLNYFTPYSVEKEIFPTQWFESVIECKFENTTIFLPNGVHEYLTQLYGDYMTPPSEDKRESTHGHYFIDLSRRLSVDEIMSVVNNVE